MLRASISEDVYEVISAVILLNKMYEFRVLDLSFRTYFVFYYFEINLSPSFDKKGIRALTIDKDNAPKVLSLYVCVVLQNFPILCFNLSRFQLRVNLCRKLLALFTTTTSKNGKFRPCLCMLVVANMGNFGHVFTSAK